jgi:hypothetical protein
MATGNQTQKLDRVLQLFQRLEWDRPQRGAKQRLVIGHLHRQFGNSVVGSPVYAKCRRKHGRSTHWVGVDIVARGGTGTINMDDLDAIDYKAPFSYIAESGFRVQEWAPVMHAYIKECFVRVGRFTRMQVETPKCGREFRLNRDKAFGLIEDELDEIKAQAAQEEHTMVVHGGGFTAVNHVTAIPAAQEEQDDEEQENQGDEEQENQGDEEQENQDGEDIMMENGGGFTAVNHVTVIPTVVPELRPALCDTALQNYMTEPPPTDGRTLLKC